MTVMVMIMVVTMLDGKMLVSVRVDYNTMERIDYYQYLWISRLRSCFSCRNNFFYYHVHDKLLTVL